MTTFNISVRNIFQRKGMSMLTGRTKARVAYARELENWKTNSHLSLTSHVETIPLSRVWEMKIFCDLSKNVQLPHAHGL